MSNSYTAPLDDTLFILEHVIRWETLFDLRAYRHVDSDLARAVLTEAALLARCAQPGFVAQDLLNQFSRTPGLGGRGFNDPCLPLPVAVIPETDRGLQ